MTDSGKKIRVVISGGGTGGHLFPAIAIAQRIKALNPESEIVFVGALGKMEMEKVPQYGFDIIGLPIQGFNRSSILKNITLPFKLIKSLIKSFKLINKFKPDVAVGVGGYASGPLLWAAEKKGVPALLQEQNSYPGVTNKLLAKRAKKICVAFPEMERFFPEEKMVFTGNPIRSNIKKLDKTECKEKLGFDPKKPLLLVVGGSLGARTINGALLNGFQKYKEMRVQLYWQTGKIYHESILKQLGFRLDPSIKISAFIDDMDVAYGAADLVISRAGALSISELSFLAKPSILVPSPNVAEDHQTKNAKVLSERDAAMLIKDDEADDELVDQSIELIRDEDGLDKMSKNSAALAKPQATQHIVEEIMKLI